jgi:hypothetical protein
MGLASADICDSMVRTASSNFVGTLIRSQADLLEWLTSRSYDERVQDAHTQFTSDPRCLLPLAEALNQEKFHFSACCNGLSDLDTRSERYFVTLRYHHTRVQRCALLHACSDKCD